MNPETSDQVAENAEQRANLVEESQSEAEIRRQCEARVPIAKKETHTLLTEETNRPHIQRANKLVNKRRQFVDEDADLYQQDINYLSEKRITNMKALRHERADLDKNRIKLGENEASQRELRLKCGSPLAQAGILVPGINDEIFESLGIKPKIVLKRASLTKTGLQNSPTTGSVLDTKDKQEIAFSASNQPTLRKSPISIIYWIATMLIGMFFGVITLGGVTYTINIEDMTQGNINWILAPFAMIGIGALTVMKLMTESQARYVAEYQARQLSPTGMVRTVFIGKSAAVVAFALIIFVAEIFGIRATVLIGGETEAQANFVACFVAPLISLIYIVGCWFYTHESTIKVFEATLPAPQQEVDAATGASPEQERRIHLLLEDPIFKDAYDRLQEYRDLEKEAERLREEMDRQQTRMKELEIWPPRNRNLVEKRIKIRLWMRELDEAILLLQSMSPSDVSWDNIYTNALKQPDIDPACLHDLVETELMG